MEYQKIVNYLHDAEKHHSKCKTRKWIEVNNEIRRVTVEFLNLMQ